MFSHSDGVVASIERNKLRLEHDVAVDLKSASRSSLEATEASFILLAMTKYSRWGDLTSSSSIDRSKVNIITPNLRHVISTHINHQIRQLGVTREGNASYSLIVDSALDLTVVCIDNCRVGDHEGGSGISDGLATSKSHCSAGADSELLGRKLPESRRGVDSSPTERAVEFRRVDISKLVGSDGGVAEVGSEDGHGEGGHGVVEESLLRGGLDGVEFGECETDQSVGLGVLDERGGDLGGELNGLAGDCCAADVDGVSSDVSNCSGSITVGDGEGRALLEFESGGL